MSKRNDVSVIDLSSMILCSLNEGSATIEKAIHCLKSNHMAYLDMSVNPSDYQDASTFAADYLAVELMSKYPYLDVDINRESVALEKFATVEKGLISTNQLIRCLRNRSLALPRDHHWVFYTACEKIRRCLGPFSWSRAERYFSFGPGASLGLPRKQSDAYNKFGCLNPTVTPGAADLAEAAIRSNGIWKEFFFPDSPSLGPLARLKPVLGNRIVTVPKNAKTDRVIAIEPLFNMYFQKGIGGVMRNCLRRVGVDLNSQLLNQELARVGSADGTLATIDLSSASDSIAMEVVDEMLPPCWVSAIKATRSPYGVLPSGEIITYQKVSSMGNGFTFELESLIFWALAESAIEYLKLEDRRLAVYGDDLIVPVEAVGLLVDVLALLGFTTNSKKTFSAGPFRESCGKHFFLGTEVTPFYVRENLRGSERLFWAANTVRSYAHTLLGCGYGCDSRLKGVWDFIVSQLSPRARSCEGPLWLENQLATTHLGVCFDEAAPICRRHVRGFGGLMYRRLSRVYGATCKDDFPALIRWSERHRSPAVVPPWHQMPWRFSSFGTDFRNEWDGVSITEYPTPRYRLCLSRGITQQWQEPGPWI